MVDTEDSAATNAEVAETVEAAEAAADVVDAVPVIDGHNDTLLRCTDDERRAEKSAAVSEEVPGVDEAFLERDGGHLDLPRALESPLAVGIFASFVPSSADPNTEPVDVHDGELPAAIDPEVAERVVLDQLSALNRWARASDAFRIVEDIDDLDDCLDGESLGAIAHVEGAAAIAPDLSNLDLLYAAGLRSVGITWSRPNQFGNGVPFVHDASPDTGDGLTDAGHDLVRACDERGILVDCAHLNEAGFWDVVEASANPPVVSHTGAHAVCPATRNLTDEQLAAIGDENGLVGLTFGTGFLHPEGDSDDDMPVEIMVDHIDHFVEQAGIDCVGLGSDFDGAGIPEAIGDVRGLNVLLDALRDRGYSEEEIEAIAYRNWRRVFANVWS
ncbi:dipeptidase [Haloparvum sp. PAK95]|uniref:dipeptidase n=1 Tax=Haloparvum sp. PAK95 TaxID=3418962 RepID=UPI003D2EA91A